MNKKLLKYYFEWCCIIMYSITLGVYAFSKPTQFGNRLEIATPVNELNGFRLMWAFYGYSTTYPIIIGIFQLLSIILIIPKKTRLIGCLIGTIILSNIILQDIIYNVPFGAIFNAIYLQLLILVILLFNKNRVIKVIKSIIYTEKESEIKTTTKSKILNIILAVITFILFYFILEGIWILIKMI